MHRYSARFASLALGLALGLALAACGSDTDSTATDGTTDNTTDNTATDGGGNGTTSPGDGAPIGGDAGAIGTIEITITHPDAEPLTYTIGCTGDAFPVTPEVPGVSGEQACQRLADEMVLDRLVNGAPADRMCAEIYGGPDVATIVGEINGRTIDTTVDRTNGCGIAEWDELLAGVLPGARGL